MFKSKHLWTSVYHTKTDRLVGRFNKTLKGMKFLEKDGPDSDCLLPCLLFGILEFPGASMGFSPFELVCGQLLPGLLDAGKKDKKIQETTPYWSIVEHIEVFRNHLSLPPG